MVKGDSEAPIDGGNVIIQMRYFGAAAAYREPQSSNDFT